MNPSDTQKLQDFLNQLVQARGVAKDPQADALIARAVAQQPDAAYLLVQRALLVEQALGNAKQRIEALESQGGKSAGGFLDPNAWGNSASSQPSNPVPGMAGGYTGSAAPSAQAAPAQSGGFMRSGAGSMLGTVAATAAGVAAGSFLFHGIGNLLGNDEHGSSNHLLADKSAGEHAGVQSDSALADQAGIGSIDEPGGGVDDSLADNIDDSPSGFFDGDGSDEGLFG